MMDILKYRFLLLSLLAISSVTCAQENQQSNVIYVKVLESQGSVAPNQFRLREVNEIKSIIPLRPTSTNSRVAKSILDGLYKVYVDEATDVNALCEKLNLQSNVVYAEPLPTHELQYIPNDPSASNGNQSYLGVIKAFEAWDITKGSDEIIIGVIDTGLDFTHEDILPQVWINSNDPPNGIDDDNNGYIDDHRGYDFSAKDTSAQTLRSFHGNRVGGIASAATDNELGIAGIGFNTKIAALKAYNEETNFIDAGYEAILYAADMGFDIVNLSYGSASFYSQAGQDIISYAVLEKDMIVIAAAGNSNIDQPFYPAAFDHVLSVAATNINDTKASFSTYHRTVDISAPGNDIYSTFKDQGYATSDGTSFSAPMAAGAAALVKSVFPDYNALQVIERIRVTSDPINDLNPDYQDQLGFGRLNIQEALTNTETKSVRILDLSRINEDVQPIIDPEDTLSFQFTLHNYLNPTENLSLSISSSSPYVSFLNDPIEIGSLGTMATKDTILTGVKIAFDTPDKTEITLKIEIEDGSYSDYHLIEIITSEDRKDLDNGEILVTLDGEGQIGSPYDTPDDGFGLRWNGNTRASRMGLLVKNQNGSVSDNLPDEIKSITSTLDFTNQIPVSLEDYSTAAYHLSTTYNDDNSPSPIGIVVEQNTITNHLSDFLIQEYRLANKTSTNLIDLSLGLYIDWDLSYDYSDRIFYNDSDSILVAFHADSSVYAGIKLLSDQAGIALALDLGNYHDNAQDIENALDDDIITNLIVANDYESAGFLGDGNDIAALVVADSIDLMPLSSERLAFAVGFGESYSDLLIVMERANTLYNSYRQTPELVETIYVCPDSPTTINPTSGDNFLFYADPLEMQRLDSGSSLTIGALNKDTAFYVINLDNEYDAAVRKLEVLPTDLNADFELSTDTLFLDMPNNPVTFTDISNNAKTWFWDFDNGSQTTLQNPTVYFNEPGVFNISLTIETTEGCSVSTSKVLLVVERPEIPEILDQSVCINESILISGTNTSSIAVYASPTDEVPMHVGESFLLQNITSDTTLYVTNNTNSFESLKKPVNITVAQVNPTYLLIPDTTTASTGAVLINTTNNTQTATWKIDGDLIGDTDTVKLLIEDTFIDFSLSVTNQTGCTDSISLGVDLSSSALPTVDFDQPCSGEALTLTPSNGSSFGFYTLPDLDQLISKGQSVYLSNLDQDTSFYIVGLDSIIPSGFLEVLVKPISRDLSIIADPTDTLYLTESSVVSFSPSTALSNSQWYINGIFSETSQSPVMFFDQAGMYRIVVQGENSAGCYVTDSLSYTVLDERPAPITLRTYKDPLNIFPNPTRGSIEISKEISESLEIINVMGQVILRNNSTSTQVTLDLTPYASGLYFVRSNKRSNIRRLILQK